MTGATHTPTPWQASYFVDQPHNRAPESIKRLRSSEEDLIIRDGNSRVGSPGCNIIGRFQSKADRDFAVRAVNAHDDLVKAATAVLDYAGMDEHLSSDRDDNLAWGIRLGDLRALRAALAKVRGAP